MKTKPSFVADCCNSAQYMFHREQRHICRRPAEISNPMKFLHSQTQYLYLHRKSQSFQTLIKSRLTLELTCMRQIWSSGVPMPVAARSKVWVCGLSPVEIAVFNPTGGMDVCLLRVLSGRGLCDELITRPEESYRLWCVIVCDLETSVMRRPWPTGGCCDKKKKKR